MTPQFKDLKETTERKGLQVRVGRMRLAASSPRHSRIGEISDAKRRVVRTQRQDILAIKDVDEKKASVLRILDEAGSISAEIPALHAWDFFIPKDSPIIWIARNDLGDSYNGEGFYARTGVFQFDFKGNQKVHLPKSTVGVIDRSGAFSRKNGELLLVHTINGDVRLTRISSTGQILSGTSLPMAVREDIRFLQDGTFIALQLFDPKSKRRWSALYSIGGKLMFEVVADTNPTRILAVTSSGRQALLSKGVGKEENIELREIGGAGMTRNSFQVPFRIWEAAVSEDLETIVVRSNPAYDGKDLQSAYLVMGKDGAPIAMMDDINPWGDSSGSIEFQGKTVRLMCGIEQVTLEGTDESAGR